METPIIELRGVAKHYGEGPTRVDALKPLDLDIHAGSLIGLLGPSGSGKSTVLNLIGGIVDPSAGRVRLDGDVVFDGRWLRRDLRRMRLEKIGFIFQFHNLIPFLSVTDNIALVLNLAGWSRPEAERRTLDLLEYLQVADRAQAMPSQLSGGQAQRVAIARALANRPRIILADEPTAALDGERAGIVMDLLRKVAVEQAAAVVVVTHDEKIMNRLDATHVLRDGVLVA
ncbi:MAG: ABC transporter ATP-binding protein [Magnetospirillum sp.]|nr:ABC transporter ATP-binding protein [Magnetospirillum sp.]